MPLSTADFYEKCYDLLVEKVGAPEAQRSGFMAYFCGHRALEWRFGGVFGLWGYFYSDSTTYIYAPETKDPQLLKLVDEVNAALKDLRVQAEKGSEMSDLGVSKGE